VAVAGAGSAAEGSASGGLLSAIVYITIPGCRTRRCRVMCGRAPIRKASRSGVE
jgi:hypothetical protein